MQRFATRLEERRQAGNLRSLRLPQASVDFFSNDYLGLARSEELSALIARTYQEELQLQKQANGSTGSRLLSGNSPFAMQLEQKLATLFRAESVLLFNSGYHANAALLSTITQKGDMIIYDELIHASLREGYRLSFAQHLAFAHNDLNDLEKKLRSTQSVQGEKFVVIESVYSMDGDNSELEASVKLCNQYGAHVILDEAHSTGIFGTHGNGLACATQIEDLILARVYTFGKGMGVHGACVAGSRLLTDYLVNFARAFIYTTGMPLHGLVSISCAFDYLAQHPELQQQLYDRIAHYRREIASLNRPGWQVICNESPIQVIGISGNQACRAVADALIANDLEVRAILSPTVKAGEERLRICLHNFNTAAQITALTETLKSIPG